MDGGLNSKLPIWTAWLRLRCLFLTLLHGLMIGHVFLFAPFSHLSRHHGAISYHTRRKTSTLYSVIFLLRMRLTSPSAVLTASSLKWVLTV